MLIRRATADDENMIRASWIRSFASSDMALVATPHTQAHTSVCSACGRHALKKDRIDGGHIRYRAGEVYWKGQAKLVDRLLGTCNVSVAEAQDGLVDGFVVRELVHPVVHFVYVRHSARGQGVAKALLDDLLSQPTRFTHWSGGLHASKVPPGWRHDPYALMVGP